MKLVKHMALYMYISLVVVNHYCYDEYCCNKSILMKYYPIPASRNGMRSLSMGDTSCFSHQSISQEYQWTKLGKAFSSSHTLPVHISKILTNDSRQMHLVDLFCSYLTNLLSWLQPAATWTYCILSNAIYLNVDANANANANVKYESPTTGLNWTKSH